MDRLYQKEKRKNARNSPGLAKESGRRKNPCTGFRKKEKKGEKTIYRIFLAGILSGLPRKRYIYGEHLNICRKQDFE